MTGEPLDPPVRMLIVEDHAVVAEALETMFSLTDEFEIVARTDSGAVAVELAAHHHPDVVLMDITLNGMDGIGATRLLRERTPHCNVLVLTMHDDAETVERAIAAGAAGFVPKNAKREDLVDAIRSVAAGDGYLHRDLAGGFIRRVAPLISASMAGERLTEREVEVLQLLADGQSSQGIAGSLTVSEETVKTHLRHIYRKLGVSDRTQAVAAALRKGLVS